MINYDIGRLCGSLAYEQAEIKNNYRTDNGFGKMLSDAASVSAAGASKTNEGRAADSMTMSEYKSFIYDRISEIQMHPTRLLDNIAINISDAGFEAMKNDPDYEKWVLDYLKEDFAIADPWVSVCGGAYSVFEFGAAKEEFHAQGWYAGYQNGSGREIYESRTKNSFWEHRMDKTEEYFEQREELRLKRYRAQLRMTQLQMLYGRDFKGITPTLSAAEILFGDDLLMGGGV